MPIRHLEATEHPEPPAAPRGFCPPSLDAALVHETALRNRVDLLGVPLAMGWHLSGVVVVISLLPHKWAPPSGRALVFLLLSRVL